MTLEQVVDPKSFVFHAVEFTGLSFDASASLDGGLNRITQNGTFHEASGNVPEPAAAVLLTTGLLVLAGSRWLPVRGARQQLG